MQAYLAFAKKSFVKNMAYRAEVWLKIFGNFVLILIQVSIWKSLIGNGFVKGVTLTEMITYSVITTAVYNVLMLGAHSQLDEKLRTGSISVDLQKPISYPFQLFSDQIGLILYQLCFTVIPLLGLSAVIFGIQAPTIINVLPFIISVFIAIIISFLLGLLIALIAFWVLTTFALRWTLNAFITVFAGTFVPLWFFTPFWAKVADVLPFQFIGFVPTAIYLGKMDGPYMAIIKGFLWVLVLLFIIFFLWKRAIKNLVVQGG